MNDHHLNELNLLLAHDDDGAPVLETGLSDQAASRAERPADDLLNFWDESELADDLEAQRWGVIAPEGPEGDRLLDLIRPLIDARKEAQDGHEVLILRAPARLLPEDASRWNKDVFKKAAKPTDLPRYQLILGDLHQVPLSIQQTQGVDGFVGRLCFHDERGYEEYVQKVLRWEKMRSEDEARAKCFTVHDGTAATMIGYRSLIKSGIELLQEQQYEVQDTGDRDDPSVDEFLELVRSAEPTMLFSVSHGAGAPRGGWKSHNEQRDRQGAMSFGRAGKLAAGDVGEDPFLPGGIWFMLACYGAGTPDQSAYEPWLRQLKQVGQFGGQAESVLAALPKGEAPPFIAALPQRVLAKPNGPLAIMGHVDLAWTYSFEERDSGIVQKRPQKFMEVIRTALMGDRVGMSFRELLRYLINTNHEVTDLYHAAAQKGGSDMGARLGHLWMLRQDLAGYILLGDPAVRLPVAQKRKQRRAAKLASKMRDLGTLASRPAEARGPAPGAFSGAEESAAPAPKLPIEIDKLEEAIGHLITGELAPKKVAEQYGVDRADLERFKEIYTRAGRAALGVK